MRVCNVDSACAHENIPSNSSTVAFFFPRQNSRTWPSADADDAYPREPFRRDHNVDILTIWQFYNNNDDNYYCGDNYTRGDTRVFVCACTRCSPTQARRIMQIITLLLIIITIIRFVVRAFTAKHTCEPIFCRFDKRLKNVTVDSS